MLSAEKAEGFTSQSARLGKQHRMPLVEVGGEGLPGTTDLEQGAVEKPSGGQRTWP